MAKKKKATYTKSKQKQAPTKKSNVLQEQKPASKGEILFFRIGMLIVSLVVVGVIAIFAINYFTSEDEDTNPYEDYITISQTSLDIIVVDNGDNTFGTRDDFQGYEEYETLLSLLNSNEVVYFYFYHSSDINEDIEEAILAQTDVNAIPTYTLLDENEDEDYLAFFFIDLDSTLNSELFNDDIISHLELDEEAEQMLVTFNVYSEDEDEFFTMESEAEDIIEIIEGLN